MKLISGISKVNSTASINIVYGGKKIMSRSSCYWKVKVFANKGESDWSGVNYWTMGLTGREDWKQNGSVMIKLRHGIVFRNVKIICQVFAKRI